MASVEDDFKLNEALMIEKINELDVHPTVKHNLLNGVKNYNQIFKGLIKLIK